MVDKLVLLESSPFILESNVRTGLSCVLSLGETWVRSQVVPSALPPSVGREEVAEGRQGASGPPPRGQGYATYTLGVGKEQGMRAWVILGNPVCGLESAECQLGHEAAGLREGRSSGLRKLWGRTVGWTHLHSRSVKCL